MSIRSLPSMEHTFSIDLQGDETGQQFAGTFTYKRPNIKTQSEIAKTVARLNEDIKGLDEDTKSLHNIMATLRHTLIAAPDWWIKADKGFDIYDLNVVFEIYRQCSDFYAKWMAEVWAGEETKKEA